MLFLEVAGAESQESVKRIYQLSNTGKLVLLNILLCLILEKGSLFFLSFRSDFIFFSIYLILMIYKRFKSWGLYYF